MSGGRFLVSLNEVYCSESILKLKTFLSKNIELTIITSSLTDEQSTTIQDLVHSITQGDFDH